MQKYQGCRNTTPMGMRLVPVESDPDQYQAQLYVRSSSIPQKRGIVFAYPASPSRMKSGDEDDNTNQPPLEDYNWHFKRPSAKANHSFVSLPSTAQLGLIDVPVLSGKVSSARQTMPSGPILNSNLPSKTRGSRRRVVVMSVAVGSKRGSWAARSSSSTTGVRTYATVFNRGF